MAAPTVVKTGFFSVGNKKQANLNITMGAASGVFDTGLNVIDHVLVSPVSLTTALMTVKKNLGSQSTAINGRLSINSSATGDEFFVTVYGRQILKFK